ncbi:hypothetical protein LSAT2_016894 [Lamellibrachia satsuma]|nr:hypothetical protein LSAT2_016894 [Lamellibrachia satsuma]
MMVAAAFHSIIQLWNVMISNDGGLVTREIGLAHLPSSTILGQLALFATRLHQESVGQGPQLFQTFTVHTSPITKVMLSAKHLVSVCSEYNHVHTWNVT